MSKYWDVKNKINDLVRGKIIDYQNNNKAKISKLVREYAQINGFAEELDRYKKLSKKNDEIEAEMLRIKNIVGRIMNKTFYSSSMIITIEADIVENLPAVKQIKTMEEKLSFDILLAGSGKNVSALIEKFITALDKIK